MITLLATFIGYSVLTTAVFYGAWFLYALATKRILFKRKTINTKQKGSN